MNQPSSVSDSLPSADPAQPPRRGFGLLTPVRQGRLLRGIAMRLQQGRIHRDQLIITHQQQTEQLEQELAETQQRTMTQCRAERRSMLAAWDEADEQAIASYEQQTLQAREARHHALASIRHQRKREITEEERSFDTEKHLVQSRYAREKPKAAKLQRTEFAQLAAGMRRIHGALTTARELTMRRCGGPEQLAALVPASPHDASATAGEPPAVSGGQPSVADEPQSLPECLQRVNALADQTERLLGEMRSGWPAKFVESYYLPLLMLAVLLAWCGIVFVLGPERLALWMLMGIPVAIVTGITAHSLLAIPLRRQTRELHPRLEQTALDAQAISTVGRRLSATKAAVRGSELKRERDASLAHLLQQHEQRMSEIRERHAAEQTRITHQFDDQIVSIEQAFQQRYSDVSRDMAERAETTSATLSGGLDHLETENQRRKQALHESQLAELEHLQARTESGLKRAIRSLQTAQQSVSRRFPPWQALQQSTEPPAAPLRWLPLGTIDVAERLRESFPGEPPGEATSLPLVLVRESQAAVWIDCPPEQMHVASELVRATLWRGLTAVPGGRLRLTLMDPVGRGQNFASLVSLADYDPQLITHRVWSSAPQITTRLSELTQHVEDVLQTCLRDRYDTIEAFNEEAGALAEPYRVVAAIGLPAGLTREGYDSLRALIEGGRRCGVFLILVRDSSQPWPTELPPLPESAMLRLRIDERGRLCHSHPELATLPITAIDPPPASYLPELVERVGRQAVAGQRVEIPLDDLLSPAEYDAGDSAEELRIPVGRQGVGRSLEIELGSGMRQHMLVAGKTGSGKSTLLHALITAAALHYAPDQLHLYLLDFKKGVEFKVYADERLPHARVIGIESQREFGRSVLERLDAELQQRGEQFRAAGVQELSEYRRQTGQTLPRILLVVDEFQEWFVRDDRVAQECTMLLDRLVRQGRSFGIHVVLSSQSLSGAYSLPRATLGQMAVRIALQCSESDAALILSDDNPAARLLSRPGEAIFNDAGGLVEGNQPFQVAWLDPQQHRRQLSALYARHPDADRVYGATVVFEGNRPTRWTPELAERSLGMAGDSGDLPSHAFSGLLGEAVRIGPPCTLTLTDATGRNVLCMTDPDTLSGVLTAWLPTAVADVRRRWGSGLEILLLDGQRSQAGSHSLGDWLQAAGIDCRVVRPRDAERTLVQLVEQIRMRHSELASREDTEESPPALQSPTAVVISGLERFRDLRQDDSFGFSLDDSAAPNGGSALQTLLRDGPAVGYHVILGCSNAETLVRWLPRSSHHDLELRILGRTSASDSAQLIDTPEAADLTPATLLMYDDAGGTLEKFRLCSTPEPAEVKRWLQS